MRPIATRHVVGGIVLVAVTGWPSVSRGQLMQAPVGSTHGAFGDGRLGGGSTQRWFVTGDGSAGEDREPQAAPGLPGSLRAGQVAATAAAATTYWRGRQSTFFQAQGGGSYTRQSIGAQSLRTVDGAGQFSKVFGLRTGISGAGSVNYQPLQLLDLLGPPGAAPVDPGSTVVPSDLGTIRGVRQQHITMATLGAGAFRAWSPRQRLEGNYARQIWITRGGPGFEGHSDTVALREWWNLSPRNSIFASYTFNQSRRTDLADAQGRVQSGEAGWRLVRGVSTRPWTFQMQGGVANAASLPVSGAAASSAYAAVGSALVQGNLGPRLAVLVRGSREVSALNGVSAEPFLTHQAEGQLGGSLSRRFSFGLSGVYSRGSSATGATGSFSGTSGNARLQYALARWYAAFASYSYYTHRVVQVAAAIQGLPSNYERHLWRAGVTLWLPLIGSY